MATRILNSSTILAACKNFIPHNTAMASSTTTTPLPLVKNNFTVKLEKEIGKFDSKAFQQKTLNLLKFLSSPTKKKIPLFTRKLNIKTPLSTNNTLSPPSTLKSCYRSVSLSLSNKLNNNPSDDIKKDQYYMKYNELIMLKSDNIFNKGISPSSSNDELLLTNRIRYKKRSSSVSILTAKDINDINNKNTLRKHNSNNTDKHVNVKEIVIKNKFKKEDQFVNFLITKYIRLKGFTPLNSNYRNVFVLLDNTLIINENIKGCFMDIPTNEHIKRNKINTTELTLLLLKKCTELFKQNNILSYIFTSNKQLLFDISQIPLDSEYIIVSSSYILKGIKILSSPSLIKLYQKEYTNFTKEQEQDNEVSSLIKRNSSFMNKHRNTKHKDKDKEEQSYNNIEINNTFPGVVKDNTYKVFYSEPNDHKKQQIQNEIHENCYNKNDFFIYIHNKQSTKRINTLKHKILRNNLLTTRKQLKNDYKSFYCDYKKLLNRFTKDYFPQYYNRLKLLHTKQLKNPSDLLSISIKIHNMQHPTTPYDKLYLPKHIPHYKQKLNYVSNNFYYTLNNKLNEHYPHLMVFNVKNMLSKYKNYDRKNLYQIFVLYKNLITLCYSLNQNDLILDYGIDFETFYKCVQEISEEKEEFTQKLFMQVDKKKIGLLSLDDFIEGMSFIQNTDLKEKLDLFLKVLDERGNGTLDYNEVKDICRDSIKRNMFDLDSKKKPCDALEELATFFAKFIFQLVNVDITQPLELEKIKSAIISGNNTEAPYLEMFCGANKIN